MLAEELKIFLRGYNFRPNNLLGQNFLLDEEVLEQIADAAELSGRDQVLEIGPGIGNLTELLAARAGLVLAIEKDQRYFPILRDRLGDKLMAHTRTPKSSANVQLVFGDATIFNFQEILKPGYKVVANIPYYITGKIIEMLLAAKKRPARIIILVQKEVAERIVAGAGELSILALSVQLYCDAKMLGIVPKEMFYPKPEVDSAILALDVLSKPRLAVDEKKFFRIIKAAFAGKRKQIHNTLRDNLKIPESKLAEFFKKGIFDPKDRPQQLTLEQWYELYKFIEKQR